MKIVVAFLILGLAVFFIRLLIKPKPRKKTSPRPAPVKTRKEPPKKAAPPPRRPLKKTAPPPKLSLEEVKKIKHRTIMQQVAFQDPAKIATLVKMALREKDFRA